MDRQKTDIKTDKTIVQKKSDTKNINLEREILAKRQLPTHTA